MAFLPKLRAGLPTALLGLALVCGYSPIHSIFPHNGWSWPWYADVVLQGKPAPIEAAWSVGAGAALLLGIVTLAWFRRERGADHGRDPADWLMLALPAWLLFAGLVLKVPASVLAIGMWPHVLAVLFYFFARELGVELSPTLVACVLAAGVLAVSVLMDAEGWMRRAAHRPGGLFASRNLAGEFLALCLPSLLAFSPPPEGGTARRRFHYAALIPAALLLGSALVLTRSRTAWISAALGSFVMLALAQGARRRMLLTLSLVLLGAGMGVNLPTKLVWKDEHPFRSSAQRLFDITSGSGAFRAEQHRVTLGIAREHPVLGVGPGQWRQAMMAAKGDAKLYTNPMPSSDYLRYLADGGFVALALFLGLGACFLRRAWKIRTAHPHVLASLLVCATIGLADPPLFRVELTILFCVLVAALMNQPSTPPAR